MNLKAQWLVIQRDTKRVIGTAERFDDAVRAIYAALVAGVKADVVKNIYAVKA